MTGQNLNTDVLIVGAGPTGLMAANQLMRFGIDFIIVDMKSAPTIESRAILVTPRSLELYQQIGLDQKAINNGQKITSFKLYSNGKQRAQIVIGELGKGFSEYSYMLGFEQSKNESLLVQNLTDHDKEVLWEHEFISLNKSNNKSTALLKNKDGNLSVDARYVIGCEGAKSPIRHQLNFSFKGGTYEQKFFVVDTVLDWEISDNQLIIAPGSKNFCAFLPLATDKSYRIIGTLPKAVSQNENITFEDLKEVVTKTIGVPIKFESVNWFSIYKLHHRAVDHFSKGNIFLAGDSAHIHSPAGGQGMNTGLQDAHNLSWKLAMVIKEQADASLLDTYNEERLPVAKALLKFTDRGFTMMTSTNWFVKLFRKFMLLVFAGFALKNKRIRSIAFKTLSQTAYSYKKSSLSKSVSRQRLSFKAGDRFPFFEHDNIYSKLTEASFHMVHVAEAPLDKKWGDLKSEFTFPVVLVEEKLDSKWQKSGVKNELFILVRPDNYIALIYDNVNPDSIKDYLKRYFRIEKTLANKT